MANPNPKVPRHIPLDLNKVTGAAAKAASAATQAGKGLKIRRLSKSDMLKMTPEQIKAYYQQERKALRSDTRALKKSQRQARRDIKAGQASELAIHQTIRQGIAEFAGVGAEGVGSYAITKGSSSANAVTQNVNGGVETEKPSKEDPGNGPLASYPGRDEE